VLAAVVVEVVDPEVKTPGRSKAVHSACKAEAFRYPANIDSNLDNPVSD
jgi:hypothetical protein